MRTSSSSSSPASSSSLSSSLRRRRLAAWARQGPQRRGQRRPLDAPRLLYHVSDFNRKETLKRNLSGTPLAQVYRPDIKNRLLLIATMAEIFHQKSNKTRSSGTDKVSNSGLGPDSDQSANSFLPHDAGKFMTAVNAMVPTADSRFHSSEAFRGWRRRQAQVGGSSVRLIARCYLHSAGRN